MTLRFRDEPPPQGIAHTTCDELQSACAVTSRHRVRRWSVLRVVAIALIALAVCRIAPLGLAADFTEDFEGERPSWRIHVSNQRSTQVKAQRRSKVAVKSGQASEEVQIAVDGNWQIVRLEHDLPPSVPIEDVSLSVALKSSVPATTLAVRMVFPRQIDPRNGKVLTCYVLGDRYTDVGHWQTLTVVPSDRVLKDRIARLRSELISEQLDLNDAYFDRAILLADIAPGTGAFYIDDMRWKGHASPTKRESPPPKIEEPRTQTSHAQMRRDRLLIDGKPVIPRFAPHHDEPVGRLQALGLNLVWIDDYTDVKRLNELREYGLWALATPPQPPSSDTESPGDASLSLEPFDEKTDGIIAWWMSNRLPAEARQEIEAQARVVRAADRDRARPLLADIGGLERTYSRLFDGVGLSRHPLQTEFEIKDYRQFLTQKVRQLRPGMFVSTWLQTEIEPRPGVTTPQLVEPEQIRLLAYAALAAGCRGIGYWKTSSFHGEFPGARERELIIAIINQEIELLEPWLATRTVTHFEKVPLGEFVKTRETFLDRNKPVSTRLRVKDPPKIANAPGGPAEEFRSYVDDEIEMAIFHGPDSQLLIPMWYERDSQFVPGHMAAKNIEITIPGTFDNPTIWEVSTTKVRSLKYERVAGTKVRLENFDQLTAIVISTDPNLGNLLRQRVETMQERSAVLWLSLAQAKLERTREVDQRLQKLGAGIPDVPWYLDRAAGLTKAGADNFERIAATRSNSGSQVRQTNYTTTADYDAIRFSAQAALQAVRIAQRMHWENAVGNQRSPLYTPYLVSFQSLPEHRQFIERIGAAPAGQIANLLADGDFENTDTNRMIAAGWKHSQIEIDGVQAGAELGQNPRPHGRALRLLAIPKQNVADMPVVLEGSPISVSTPPINVRTGQFVYVSGSVRLSIPPTASIEGVTLTENLANTRLHWKQTRGWEQFEFVREVTSDTPLTLKLTLHGLGEAQFDDLRIVAVEPQEAFKAEPKRRAAALPSNP